MQALIRYAADSRAMDDAGLLPERALTLADNRMPGRYPDALLHVAEDESTAPFLDETAFRRALRLGPAPESAGGMPDAAQNVAGASRPDEIWPWLALTLLVFVLAETFLADHRRREHAAS